MALVEYNNSYALFVLISSRTQPISFSDLSIETVIPIDHSFSCGKLLFPKISECSVYSNRFNINCWKFWVYSISIYIESFSYINKQFFILEPEPVAGQNYVILIIKYKQSRYEYNIEIGKESCNFAAELIRAKEGNYISV